MRSTWLIIAITLALAACAAPAPATRIVTSETSAPQVARSGGSITLAVLNTVPTMAPIATASSGRSFSELHTSALVSAEDHTRAPVGRLAARVPSIDNGDITVL